jgi:hypothetical protein
MKPLERGVMLEATRLTQAGRLTEATALMQRSLGGDGAEIVAGPATGLAPTAPVIAPPLAPRMTLQSLDWKAKLPGLQGRSVQPADLAPSVGRYLSGSFSNAAGAVRTSSTSRAFGTRGRAR